MNQGTRNNLSGYWLVCKVQQGSEFSIFENIVKPKKVKLNVPHFSGVQDRSVEISPISLILKYGNEYRDVFLPLS